MTNYGGQGCAGGRQPDAGHHRREPGGYRRYSYGGIISMNTFFEQDKEFKDSFWRTRSSC